MLLLYLRSYLLLPLGFLQIGLSLETQFSSGSFDLLGLALLVLLFGGGARLWSRWTHLVALKQGQGIGEGQHLIWQISLLVTDPIVSLMGLLSLYQGSGWVVRLPYLPPTLGLWVAVVLGLIPLLVVLAWRVWVPLRLEILQFHLPAPHPAKGINLLFLSDLHLGNWPDQRTLFEILGSLEALAPDLIILGGDLTDHHAKALEQNRDFFNTLAKQAPVFAILGNHDLSAGGAICSALLEDMGIQVLRDQWAHFEGRLSIFGSRDLEAENPEYTHPTEAQLPALLVIHNPNLLLSWPDLESQGFILALAGHTHGGQIHVPFLGPLVNVSDPTFVPGFNAGQPPLILSKGVGYAAFPARIGCSPDLILVSLT